MSFSKQTKEEVLNQPLDADCCGVAFLSGFLFSAGRLEISKNNSVNFFVVTDTNSVFEPLSKIIQNLYGSYILLDIGKDDNINQATSYIITFPKQLLSTMLTDTFIMGLENGKWKACPMPNIQVVSNECCERAFIRGAFLGCGTSSIKISTSPNKKTNSGYRIDFFSKNQMFLIFLQKILENYQIKSKIQQRKKDFVEYITQSQSIADLLALMGANNSMLELSSEMASRQMRNKVNRLTNCIEANISKTVTASMRQIDAINVIIENIGLDDLDFNLQQIALIRLANPEESLSELIKFGNLNLTRPTLARRFKKIERIASKILSKKHFN
ncbi:MAG: DNA-binding protein WhiA [Clostridia bacterium]